ncbi:YqgE/AlgH family protein [Lentzea waywayandensis]|uniref:YqgE/AlgH family protein n=1 Tax=Lentzea waywayandensis TaxID=84724 RepID=UPI000B86A90C|nr:YqgE/AlgH family protein [Lentzea waywayandensis]
MRPDDEVEVEPGSLLVAAPSLNDPNFTRTVVYIIDQRPEGTLGVVLNRPSEVAVYDVLPPWGSHVTKPQCIHIGGPVEQKTALCLAALKLGTDPSTVEGLVGVQGPVALVDLDAEPDDLMPLVRGLRVFAGYSGWGEGQLQGEIDRGDWIVVTGLADDVLVGANVDLWGRVLRRQGMPLALLSTYPKDVRDN